MFDFTTGWMAVLWYNVAFAGVAAAALLTTQLYARRGGAGGGLGGMAEGGEGVAAVLPGHVRYDALDDSGKDEY